MDIAVRCAVLLSWLEAVALAQNGRIVQALAAFVEVLLWQALSSLLRRTCPQECTHEALLAGQGHLVEIREVSA